MTGLISNITALNTELCAIQGTLLSQGTGKKSKAAKARIKVDIGALVLAADNCVLSASFAPFLSGCECDCATVRDGAYDCA